MTWRSRLPTFQFSIAQLLGLVTLVAAMLGTWYFCTRAERAATHIRSLGGDVEWVIDGSLVNTDMRPLPPEERYSRVVIGSEWSGGRRGLRLLNSIRQMRHLEISASTEIATLLDVNLDSLTKLRAIKIEGLSVPAQCVSQLARMTVLGDVKFVDCELDGEVVAVTSELPVLHELGLNGSRIKGHIRPAKGSSLHRIDLSQASLPDDELDWLASLKDARTILLSDTCVTNRSLLQLSALPRLQTISVVRTAVTKSGMDEFLRTAIRSDCFLYNG